MSTRHTFFVLFLSVALASSAHAMQCPSATIEDVIKNPIVVSAMNTAWSNSKEGTSDEHIEGFNIYQCRNALAVDGNVYTTEIDWGNGGVTSITYPSNRQSDSCRLVANFHTHPGVGTSHPLSNDPYESDRPSPNELKTNLPGIIRYGLGPIAGEGLTFDITYGPQLSENLSWLCDDLIPGSLAGTGAGAIGTTTTAMSATTDGTNAVQARPVSYTDPHLITLDGLAYSFQAVGEFVLAQSQTNDFVVQARQRQAGLVNSQVSTNTGFAFKAGNDQVSIAFNVSNDLLVFVNSEQVTAQGDTQLPDGGLLQVTADTIKLIWQDGSHARIDVYSGFLNLSLFVADVHKGKLTGLLGNFDNDPANDMRTRIGVDISVTPQADQLYGVFAEGWRVTDNTSLFAYFDDENTASFTDRLFPGRRFTVDDLSANAYASATRTCNNAGVTDARLLNNCILDVGATDNVEFAEAIGRVQLELADTATDIVELVVGGRLEIPDVVCAEQSLSDAQGLPVPVLTGVFVGTLTNPDVNTNWDTRLEFEQCGPRVNGLFSLSSAEGFGFKRRFEGSWLEGRLNLNLAFPYSYTLDVGLSACENMTADLIGDTSMLQGSWTSSNCIMGGLINLVRIEPLLESAVPETRK